MSKLRQILKMYSQRCSKLYISQTVGVSRNTVKTHLRTFHDLNIPVDALFMMEDVELESLFKSLPKVRNEDDLKALYSFFSKAEKKLARRGTSILDLWKEYEATYENHLGKTSFYAHYKTYKRRVSPSMHIEHKAGDKMYIDFTG